MRKYNKKEKTFTVECDACGEVLELEVVSLNDTLAEIRGDGWIVANIKNECYDFCCKNCKDAYKESLDFSDY